MPKLPGISQRDAVRVFGRLGTKLSSRAGNAQVSGRGKRSTRMCANWNNNKFDRDLLSDLIERCCVRQPDGGVSFSGFEISEYEVVLCSSLSLSDQISDVEKQTIVWKAICEAAKSGRITAQSIKSKVDQTEEHYLRRPKSQYFVRTNLSLRFRGRIVRCLSPNCRLVLSPHSPTKFDRSLIEASAKQQFSEELPRSYPTALISVLARTAHEAAYCALDGLDLLRGVWNFAINQCTLSRTSSGKVEQVNKILVGPLHTVHRSDGSLATQDYFYEKTFRGHVAGPSADEFQEALDFEKRVFKALRKSKYQEELRHGIRQYGRALDSADLDVAFLRLWNVLENLTKDPGTRKVNYDQVIGRCSSLYKDRKLVQLVLEHLRAYRNKHVHTGTNSPSVETLLYQLKRFTEQLLLFHLAGHKRFSTLAEAVRFLDLPSDKKILRFALKFHGHC